MLKDYYFNLSIKYKILILFYFIIFVVALVLGFYSTMTSEKYVINRVSSANLGVVKQLNGNLNFLQKDILDISTYLCIDDEVQERLKKANKMPDASTNSFNSSNFFRFIMNLIASKSYISALIIYCNNELPIHYDFTDMSSGVKGLYTVIQSDTYKKAVKLDGSPLWFPMLKNNNTFIQNSNYPKIGVCRVIKDYNDFKQVGFLVIGVNESTIRNMCENNIQSSKEGMLIVDNEGTIISQVGTQFYGSRLIEQDFYIKSRGNFEGYSIDNINGKEFLIAYGSFGDNWKTFYAVPMEILKKEINSINTYTLVFVLLCMLFSFPIMLLVSSLLTAPIRKLLKSMKKFQKGNFDEKVDFKYGDEIGELGKGYNNMVANIKKLIDKVYILQIKEREAELNALQAQINPHFLYNTLDTIFWKAQGKGEKDISNMVYSLSKLFRLSLNRGKSFTFVYREKELIEHYLILQKVRFKNKLNYEINIDKNIMNYIIPKLILQPFVENAILHGLEGKENGGTIRIDGEFHNDKIRFSIQDDGVGMDEQTLKSLLTLDNKSDVNTSAVSSGGYAVKNVSERLKLIFNEDYSLSFTSEPGKGTKSRNYYSGNRAE